MTTLISPVLRSLRAPRGILAICSVTMHRTLNRVLYAPRWEDREENRAVRVCTAAARIIPAQAISVAKGFSFLGLTNLTPQLDSALTFCGNCDKLVSNY